MTPFHVQVLKADLQNRSAKNPRFSLRSYAGKLGIHPSALSRILAGKLDLSVRAATLIAEKLDLTLDDRRRFLRSVNETRKKKEAKKLAASISQPDLRRRRLLVDEPAQFDDYLAVHTILELTEASDFKSDVKWIAMRLGRSTEDVEKILASMIEQKILRSEDGVLVKYAPHTTSFVGRATSEAKKKIQREILQAALKSIDSDPLELRAHLGVSFAVNPNRIGELKERLLQFLEEISDPLEIDGRTEVYQLAVQLFPLTKIAKS